MAKTPNINSVQVGSDSILRNNVENDNVAIKEFKTQEA